VVHVQQDGVKDAAKQVSVTYIRGARQRERKTRLGLLQRDDPYLCPELPDPQRKRFLSRKGPLVYTHVAIR
jgi:hypothetical protein